jgi:hypothetical protein
VLKDLDGRYLLINRTATVPAGVHPTTRSGAPPPTLPAQIAQELRSLSSSPGRDAVHREAVVEYQPESGRPS